MLTYTDLFEREGEWCSLSCQMGSIVSDVFSAEAGIHISVAAERLSYFCSCYHSDRFKHLSTPTVHGEDIVEVEVFWVHPKKGINLLMGVSQQEKVWLDLRS